jgi:hypothetical protein
MKKLVAALAFGAALMAGAAWAGTMDNSFGNTIVVTSANGEARYHFNADGTFTGVAPGGSQMAGTWTLEGDRLCLIPPGGQAPSCVAVAADKNVGDTWEQLGADGSPITVRLDAGR